jgi:hypothetical protein
MGEENEKNGNKEQNEEDKPSMELPSCRIAVLLLYA